MKHINGIITFVPRKRNIDDDNHGNVNKNNNC